jgi:hypothetical protein
MMFCVLRAMNLSRVSLGLIISVAAATAASAASPPAACAQASASADVQSLITLQSLKANSGGLCNAASALTRHASSDRGNALAPTTVRNPFLPANAIPSARPAQEPASSR